MFLVSHFPHLLVILVCLLPFKREALPWISLIKCLQEELPGLLVCREVNLWLLVSPYEAGRGSRKGLMSKLFCYKPFIKQPLSSSDPTASPCSSVGRVGSAMSPPLGSSEHSNLTLLPLSPVSSAFHLPVSILLSCLLRTPSPTPLPVLGDFFHFVPLYWDLDRKRKIHLQNPPS